MTARWFASLHHRDSDRLSTQQDRKMFDASFGRIVRVAGYEALVLSQFHARLWQSGFECEASG